MGRLLPDFPGRYGSDVVTDGKSASVVGSLLLVASLFVVHPMPGRDRGSHTTEVSRRLPVSTPTKSPQSTEVCADLDLCLFALAAFGCRLFDFVRGTDLFCPVGDLLD